MLLEFALMQSERSQVIYNDFLTFEKKCFEAGYDYPHGFSLPWPARDIAWAILSRAILVGESIRDPRIEQAFKNHFLSLSRYQTVPNSQLINLCSRELSARVNYQNAFSSFLRKVEFTNSELESAWDETLKVEECRSVFLPKSLPSRLPYLTSETSEALMHEFSGLRADGPVYESELKETYSKFSSMQLSQHLKIDPIFLTVFGFAVARLNIERGNLDGIDPKWMATAPFHFSKVKGELATLAHGDIKITDTSYISTRLKEDMFCSDYWMFLYERLFEALCNIASIEGELNDEPKSVHLRETLDEGAFPSPGKYPQSPFLIVFFVLVAVALMVMNFLMLQKVMQAHSVTMGCLSFALMLLELFVAMMLLGLISAKK